MDTEEVILILILPLAVIFAGVVVLVAALRYRARMLELVHQERVVMIERGMMPPDLGVLGSDARGFHAHAGRRSRAFSLGITVVGLGFAFMTLIGVAGQSPDAAIGIGGAIVILGAAFIVRSLLTAEAAPTTGSPVPSQPSAPAHPPLPPSTIGSAIDRDSSGS